MYTGYCMSRSLSHPKKDERTQMKSYILPKGWSRVIGSERTCVSFICSKAKFKAFGEMKRLHQFKLPFYRQLNERMQVFRYSGAWGMKNWFCTSVMPQCGTTTCCCPTHTKYVQHAPVMFCISTGHKFKILCLSVKTIHEARGLSGLCTQLYCPSIYGSFGNKIGSSA